MNSYIVHRIYDILDKHKWLADLNCTPGKTDLPAKEIKVALTYLVEHSIDMTRSTYALKHDAEKATREYIRERCFLIAAALLGYELRRVNNAIYLEQPGHTV